MLIVDWAKTDFIWLFVVVRFFFCKCVIGFVRFYFSNENSYFIVLSLTKKAIFFTICPLSSRIKEKALF